MALDTYRKKRDFSATSEPRGKQSCSHARRFVVQEHHASSLHWDLRLEMGGVLKSWAVPKGIPMDAHVKRLAIMTEDHPVEYLSYHGTIPAGSYGAGVMSIWDTGTYDVEQTGNPEYAIDHGKLSIVFHGERMNGFWEMVKTGDDEKHWLLFKVDREPTANRPAKIVGSSHESSRRDLDIAGAKAAAMPGAVKPMLAVSSAEPFSDPDWLFEIKWDGYRALCYIENGRQRLVSRNQLSLDDRFPELKDLSQAVHCRSAVIDGEIVGLDADGRSRFQLLQNRGYGRGRVKDSPHADAVVYYAFDLLYLDGYDLQPVALVERKRLLKEIIDGSGVLRYSDHVVGKGIELFEQAKKLHLEGVIGKRADSPYVQSRSDRWRKIKAVQTADVVIGGYTDPAGSRARFGSLLVGLYGENGLLGVGRAGSGFDARELDRVYALLQKLERKTSPFSSPLPDERHAHWLKPDLVCEVKFAEMTNDGQMRHPTYLRMREDKDPRECTLSAAKIAADPPLAPKPPPTKSRRKATDDGGLSVLLGGSRPDNLTMEIEGATVELTNLNKVYWPTVGKTKGDLLAFYYSVSAVVLPYLHNRPLILQRFPNGVDGEYFFQHDVKHPPSYATTFSSKQLAADVDYLVCNNLATLLYLANLGVIPLHPLPIRRENPSTPDWLVFDLDPEPQVPFEAVCELADALGTILVELGLESYAKTSGSAGMHVYVPTRPELGFGDCVHFATAVAHVAQRRLPKLVTLERMTRKRKPTEIYLDCLQNAAGMSVAGPYWVRATPTATVSTPLTWDEVAKRPDPTAFTIDTVPARIEKLGDLWIGLLKPKQSLTEAVAKLADIAGP